MLPRPLLLFTTLLLPAGAAEPAPRVHTGGSTDLNRLVLNAIGRMPTGGHYSTTSQANQRLGASIRIDGSGFALTPDVAQPSYCSGATYQIFVSVVDQLARKGSITPNPRLLQSLLVRGQTDGVGIWGRWNANGPGTAKLFADTGIGRNFTDWSQARPGDFLKVWWNNEIGQRERGHSVIFLGHDQTETGEDAVLFWSSNQPEGYGRKSVPRSKIMWAVFSRLENIEVLDRLVSLPNRDNYLASMLTRPSSQQEVAAQCRIRE